MSYKTKIAITATALCLAFTANATPQRDAYDVAETALLDNVARTIQTGMKRTETMYRQNAGVPLSTDGKDLIISGNPYVDTMKVSGNYILVTTLHSSSGSASGSANNSAALGTSADVPATMGDITITMVPIYKLNNKKITGWECVTDADEKRAEVMGEELPSPGKLSYISGITNYSFLGNCRFAGATGTGTGGTGTPETGTGG
jgi:hypothetical protein